MSIRKKELKRWALEHISCCNKSIKEIVAGCRKNDIINHVKQFWKELKTKKSIWKNQCCTVPSVACKQRNKGIVSFSVSSRFRPAKDWPLFEREREREGGRERMRLRGI